LALDASTVLESAAFPQGILYSGGRDGQVISRDLWLPTKRRKLGGRPTMSRWEHMTGWADDVVDDDPSDGEDHYVSDGDVLGDVILSARKRRPRDSNREIPYERQWELDTEAFVPGQPSQFRQSAQLHSDWVNDIVLCNNNQTVVSASSDGTVKAWTPSSGANPHTVGTHKDYVRCLAYCREQQWVASGSFDRTIKLWDLNGLSDSPVITLNPADASAPKSSVYALATDPYGSLIASGSPERVIRLWDPRSARRTGKLVGHTDNIRAMLLSDNGRYLLTGSADASIKLWSLAAQRCLHTFTHHTDSVWSLFSTHPSLEIFYSGDRAGQVCRVDVEDCADVSEGECLVLCREGDGSPTSQGNASPGSSAQEYQGINAIVVMDDSLLWTASSTSNIQRWRIPPRRAMRAAALFEDEEDVGMPQSSAKEWAPIREREDEATMYGIPFESLVRLTSPNDPFGTYSTRPGGSGDVEVATLYSAASVLSVPRRSMQSPLTPSFTHHNRTHGRTHSTSRPRTSPRTTLHTDESTSENLLSRHARLDYQTRELAADADPLLTVPDETVKGDVGIVRSVILNNRVHVLSVDMSGEVAVWDLIRCICVGRFAAADVADAWRQKRLYNTPEAPGPREALDTVRELIEGEAVVSSWCSSDSKSGVLVIHMNDKCFEAEIYADQVGFTHDRHHNEEAKFNIGKTMLRNLFNGFIVEEVKTHLVQDRRGSQSSRDSHGRERAGSHNSKEAVLYKATRASLVVSSPTMISAVPPPSSVLNPTNSLSTPRQSPLITPMIPLSSMPLAKDTHKAGLSAIPQSPRSCEQTLEGAQENDSSTPLSAAATPMPIPIRPGRSSTSDRNTSSSVKDKESDYFSVPMRMRKASVSVAGSDSGTPGPEDVTTPTLVGSPPPTPGGFMGRLKSFGKMGRKNTIDASTSPALSPASLENTPAPLNLISAVQTPQQKLLAGALSPASSNDAPLYNLPSDIVVFLSEEAEPSYHVTYRGLASQIHRDTPLLEEVMPMWLLEYLLLNVTRAPAPAKLSFILTPCVPQHPDEEQLPELLNTSQSKLTASRYLRVRKLVIHIQEKLEKLVNNSGVRSNASSVRSSLETSQDSPSSPTHGWPGKNSPGFIKSKPRAEDLYEVLCNDVVLPLDMTLIQVRHYVWKQAAELVIHYRLR
ncbi:WD40 repeat-like protein, partial [Fistulina hepatica ATCC 64428]